MAVKSTKDQHGKRRGNGRHGNVRLGGLWGVFPHTVGCLQIPDLSRNQKSNVGDSKIDDKVTIASVLLIKMATHRKSIIKAAT